MWTVSPLPGSLVERRKGQRRSGIGRRIHGERRAATASPTPDDLPPGWKPRKGDRRKQKRRVLADRRSGQAVVVSSLSA